MKRNLVIVLVLSFISLPISFALAQNRPSNAITCPGGANCPTGSNNAITCPGGPNCPQKNDSGTASGMKINIKLRNPLSGANTIEDVIKKFMGAIVRIAIPFIIIFFIWSGLSFILAQGNPTKVTQAKNMFLNTVIGMLLILGAWTITNAIIGTINTLTN
jgi:hypothetical protein